MLETAPVPILAPPSMRAFPAAGLLPRRARRSPARVAVTAAAVIAVVVGLALAWMAGLRVFVVESPSMGTAAPVGSLVLGQAGRPVATGDLITFQPPGAGSTPFTHRIVGRTGSGFTTRGDINGAVDPWVIEPSMVISRAAAVVPGAGWLIKAAPLLLVALVLAQVAGLFVRAPATRWSIRTAALAVGVAAIAWTMKPFSGFLLLNSIATPGGMRATVVSTALLPIRVNAVGGGHVDLASGQVGQLVAPRGPGGHVALASQLDLDPIGWILIALVCLLPVIAVLVVGVPVEERDDAAP